MILVRKKSSARISVEEWCARALVVTVGVLLVFLISGAGCSYEARLRTSRAFAGIAGARTSPMPEPQRNYQTTCYRLAGGTYQCVTQ